MRLRSSFTTFRICAVTLPMLAAPVEARPPACPPARYVVDAAPLIAGVSAAETDAVVIDDGPLLSIASGCPPVQAKVKGRRKGTRVRAKWRKGVCGALEGRVRFRGRIDPACRALTGTLRARRFKRRVTASLSECGDGVVDPGRGERCDPPGERGACAARQTCQGSCACLPDLAFETGMGSAVVAVDRGDPPATQGGCVATAAVVETDAGIRLRLPAGTCLGTPGGTAIPDPPVFSIDGAGGPASQGVDLAFDGVVRLSAGPPPVPTVAFEPPATLELELYHGRSGGVWAVYPLPDAGGFASGPPAGPDDERSAVFLQAIPDVPNGPERVVVLVSGVLGFVYHPQTATGLGSVARPAQHGGDTTVSLALPAASLARLPFVCGWRAISPGSAYVLAVGTPGLSMAPGVTDTHVIGPASNPRSYTGELATSGEFRVTSAFHNRLSLDVTLCDDVSESERISGLGEGGSPTELDLAGPYDGPIRLSLRGHDDVFALARQLDGVVRAPARYRTAAVFDRGAFRAGETLTETFLWGIVYDHAASERDLAAKIPGAWSFEFGDRLLAGTAMPTSTTTTSTSTSTTTTTPPPGFACTWTGTGQACDPFPGCGCDVFCSAEEPVELVITGGDDDLTATFGPGVPFSGRPLQGQATGNTLTATHQPPSDDLITLTATLQEDGTLVGRAEQTFRCGVDGQEFVCLHGIEFSLACATAP